MKAMQKVPGYYDLTEDSRTAVQTWLRSHGIDPTDAESIHYQADSHAIVTVFAKTADGKHFLDETGKATATNKVHIAEPPPDDALVVR